MHERVRIFIFHRVSEKRNTQGIATHASIFEKSIKYITKNFTVKSIEEYLAERRQGHAKYARPVACITFDDGFKDNIKYALPVLEKYSCPASFYVATDCIDNDLPTWPDLLDNIFENTRNFKLHIDSEFIKRGGVDIKFGSKQQRVEYGKKLLMKLKTIPGREVPKVMEQVMHSFSDVPGPKNCMMSWPEVKQLSAAGYPVGSHSCSHPMLTMIQSDERLMNELVLSRKRITDMVGSCSDIIAYPIGDADERVMTLAARAGYRYGLTVGQRFYNTAKDNDMAIPRVDLYCDSGWLKTYLRITGDIEKLKKITRR